MSVALLDFTASELRAWVGEPGRTWHPVRLEPDSFALPLALAAQRRRWVTGLAAQVRTRSEPHQALGSLLRFLATRQPLALGRYTITAEEALVKLLEHARPRLNHATGVLALVPAWLEIADAERLAGALARAHLTPLAILPRCLLLATEALETAASTEKVLLVEFDDAALTAAWLDRAEGHIRWHLAAQLPHLGRSSWREALIHAAAETCVHQCRRDPRAVPESDQELFNAADAWLTRPDPLAPLSAQVTFPRSEETQALVVAPTQVALALQPLIQAVADQVAGQLGSVPAPVNVLLSHPLAALPGLADAVAEKTGRRPLDVDSRSVLPLIGSALAQRLIQGELPALPVLPTALPLHDSSSAEFVFDADEATPAAARRTSSL
ncbi:MAG TPA: hypothetical protein PKD86_09735 [Gemmatales bacterium]|nr:hypothetical protein [Gemmatales bacterium]HMP59622.1 hypothetical protein [Gemmatales bacterium]